MTQAAHKAYVVTQQMRHKTTGLGLGVMGVFKALVNNHVKLDIVARTSIDGINAAIIAGSIDKDHPERMLEEFWTELGKNSVNLTNPVMEWIFDKSRATC